MCEMATEECSWHKPQKVVSKQIQSYNIKKSLIIITNFSETIQKWKHIHTEESDNNKGQLTFFHKLHESLVGLGELLEEYAKCAKDYSKFPEN